ncbi:MAG: hypothetical protein KGD59_09495 [Candidatus Heimdallarchaeota archaeon]|nr:hypothetical protein [Candidatus Heimdallarchaeota archaeon]
MTSKDSNSSDVGFVVLISFAILALIPLAIGFDSFDSFEELFRVGKIILIVVLVVAVVAGAIFGYILYKRKISSRDSKKEKNSSEYKDLEKQKGNVSKVHEERNQINQLKS